MKVAQLKAKQKKDISLACCRAFTLIELLVVIAIIALLVAIGVPSYKAQRRNAEKVVCMSKMRGLHMAFDSYMIDKNHWPQMPAGVFESEEESEFWKWWILTMAPYGGDEPYWLCPSDKVRKESEDEYNGSYLPTQFDDHHHTPYRWANQPWLLERGNLHRKGAHIMMPDGSIHSSKDVF